MPKLIVDEIKVLRGATAAAGMRLAACLSLALAIAVAPAPAAAGLAEDDMPTGVARQVTATYGKRPELERRIAERGGGAPMQEAAE